MARVAIVTGGNRGLGLETCRQLARLGMQVILTSRDASKGRAAVEALAAEGLDVEHRPLDVTRFADVEALRSWVVERFGRLDVLINGAGIMPEHGAGVLDMEADALRLTIETNTIGPARLCLAFVPLMKTAGYGRVVNVSSSLGQLARMGGGYASYRISKAALNALTRTLAAEVKGSNVLINSVCPGWVRTEMGGPDAPKSPEQGVETIVWAATLPDDGPSGEFLRDRGPINW